MRFASIQLFRHTKDREQQDGEEVNIDIVDDRSDVTLAFNGVGTHVNRLQHYPLGLNCSWFPCICKFQKKLGPK